MDDLSSESLLVTLDVISLYTNILHQEGLDACRETLNERHPAWSVRVSLQDILNPQDAFGTLAPSLAISLILYFLIT